MKVVIDLDLHEAIQDFAIKSPAGSYEFKSQDTINWLFYFVRNGEVQDLTSGMAIKFGMIATGDTSNTLLAYQTSFTYTTDSDGNVCYECPVNFNTSQMASAISGKSQLPCTAEVRYQTADAEIVHTLNISALVFPTILVETGVTPPGVSTGYPDASAIELLVHKNAANGYPGLNASSKINGSVIPVDGQTIHIDGNGNLSSSAILATVAANFTTPAANATVSVTLNSTSNLKANSYVRIPVAGYYVVTSITDSTHAVLTNNGDPFNATSGVTITSGAVLLPAQAAAGGGSAGQNAFTTSTASFTAPAVGSTVSVTMTATSWLAGSGYIVFISSAGYYAVSSVTDSTHAILTNLGYATTNAAPGTVIASGAQISPGALQGPASSATGANAYDTTQASFTMPVAAASVNVTITNTGWLGVGQEVYIAGAGYFSVASITSPTVFNATNSNYPGAAASGSTITSGAKVSPAGVIGPQGAGGAGLNAFTTLTSNFIQPAANATVAIVVGTTAWMAAGQVIYVAGGGYYLVTTITDLTHVTVTNLAYAGNASPGATVTGSGSQAISPGGLIGSTGAGAYTSTSASFVMPAAFQSVSISVGSTAALLQNQNIYIGTAGYFSVSSVVDSTHILAINLGSPGNVSSGTTIASLVGVTPAGATGPAINTSGGFSTAADAIAPAGTGEVSHIATQTGGVLALKKLKSGPAGSVALTDQGGTTGDILVDVPVDGTTIQVVSGHLVASGGGGGGQLDPKNGIFITDDFLDGAVNPPYSTDAFGVGTVNFVSTYGIDSTKKVTGSVELKTGGSSGSNSGMELFHGFLAQASPWGNIPFSLGAMVWKTRIFIEGTLPTTGIGYIFRAGIGGCNATAAAHCGSPLPGFTQGFAFAYSPDNNSGQWQIYVGTTTPTATNTSVAVVGDTAYWLECDINAAWSSFTFYINATLVATVTTGLPTIGGNPFWNILRGTSSTTNFAALVDAWYLNYQYTR